MAPALSVIGLACPGCGVSGSGCWPIRTSTTVLGFLLRRDPNGELRIGMRLAALTGGTPEDPTQMEQTLRDPARAGSQCRPEFERNHGQAPRILGRRSGRWDHPRVSARSLARRQPTRWGLLPVIDANLANGGEVARSTAIVACWARYAEGIDENGDPKFTERYRRTVESLSKKGMRHTIRDLNEPLAAVR